MRQGTKWIAQLWMEQALVQPSWHDASVAFWPLADEHNGHPIAPRYASVEAALTSGLELRPVAGRLQAAALPILAPIMARGDGLTVALWCRRDAPSAASTADPQAENELLSLSPRLESLRPRGSVRLFLRGAHIGASALGTQLGPQGPALPVGFWFVVILVIDTAVGQTSLILSDGRQLIPVSSAGVEMAAEHKQAMADSLATDVTLGAQGLSVFSVQVLSVPLDRKEQLALTRRNRPP